MMQSILFIAFLPRYHRCFPSSAPKILHLPRSATLIQEDEFCPSDCRNLRLKIPFFHPPVHQQLYFHAFHSGPSRYHPNSTPLLALLCFASLRFKYDNNKKRKFGMWAAWSAASVIAQGCSPSHLVRIRQSECLSSSIRKTCIWALLSSLATPVWPGEDLLYRLNSTFYNETKGINHQNAIRYDSKCLCMQERT
ncbi:hypothetical protein VTL71DRAFT_5060 [Oculimacula yallundae]|uniref:Uncharacterized protein n=1 Tax=Oculimacula yallundae TaxID=86028 RepID=A0ABR4C022_9HELO